MSFTRKPLALAVALTLPVASMVCAHALAAETATLPEVTVSAARGETAAPAPSTVLDTAGIAAGRAATSDTASLLRDVPGMSVYTGGGVSSLPVLDGLGDDRLRIKVDGMDLISACGNHMNPALSYIDPSSVGDIKVFAGIVPVSVGGDSIGGAIHVDSAAPEFAEPGEGTLVKGEVGAFYRSNGDALGGNLSATIASEKVSLTYTGSTAKADNYHAGDDFKSVYIDKDDGHIVDADEVGSSMYKSTNQSIALAARHENHLLELKLGLQDIPYQGWPNQRMDMTGNDSEQVNLRYEGQYDWGKLEARAYNEHTRHYMQFFDDKLYWYGNGTTIPDGTACTPSGGTAGCAAGMPMDTEGRNSGLVLKADIPLSERDLLRVGSETQRYRLDDWWDPSGKGMWPNVFWNINDGERDRLAAFGEWEAQWNPQWLTQLGLRYERVEMNAGNVQGYNPTYSPAEAAAFNAADRNKTDDNVDLTALARFAPDDMRTIEFGYARKTRSPNLYERYTWSTHGMSMRMINWAGDGNGYVGNLDLEPEIAHTLSAAFDWHDARQEKWGLKVAPYYTHVDDYIDAARCDSDPDGNACRDANLTVTDAFVYLRFVNQSANIYGLDVSGHFPLAEKTPYGSFTATGMLSYVRGENDATGDNLYNMMPLNAKLAVVQKLGGWTGTAEWLLVAAKSDVSAERNEMETDGYGLLNLRGSYAWKQARLDLGVENLLDRLYNHPLGGAYFGEGKTMSGTDIPWGVPVPGMGRSIYTALTYTF
ncbi:MAG: iron complex outerrane recepter protein [Pseudomonadota bacterium]|nr:iron complex outerrane recepter protein [Pseudomonadota bacterium]